jgi:hypothetical protein
VITGVLSQVTGQLEKRFVLDALFPTLAFSLALILVIAVITGGVDAAIAAWNGADTVVKTVLVIAWIAVVFVVANMLANGILWITRLYEGYVPPASWFAKLGQRHQLHRASDLWELDPDAVQQRFPPYPHELDANHLAPTTLGNLLLSAELYPFDRYGVDAVRMWPRLYHVIPEPLRNSMADARASMEFMLAVSFLAGLYTPLASVTLIIWAGPISWFAASLCGGTLVAVLAYVGALAPAAVYGSHVRTAYDLHRLELLESLGLPRPSTLAEEKRTWRAVTAFLDGGAQHTMRYVPKAA